MGKKPKGRKEDADCSALFGGDKTNDEMIRSFGVILERIDSNIKTLIEKLDGLTGC